MEAQSLFALLVILFLLWLIRSYFLWDSRIRQAKRSRDQLRNKLTDSTLAGRVRPGSDHAAYRAAARHGARRDTAVEAAESSAGDEALSATNRVTDAGGTIPDGAEGKLRTEITQLRARLSARDETIRQLQQSLEDSTERHAQGTARQAAETTPAFASSADDLQAQNARLSARLVDSEHTARRNQHAMEEVEKLRKSLFDRQRELEQVQQSLAKSETMVAQYKAGAQRAAMLEQQLALATARADDLKNQIHLLQERLAEHDGDTTLPGGQKTRNDSGSSAHGSDRSRRGEISGEIKGDVERSAESVRAVRVQLLEELRLAEADAGRNQQNALELGRLRSEIESLQEDHPSASRQIDSLQERFRAQQAILSRATAASPSKKPMDSTKAGKPAQPLFRAPGKSDDLKQIKGIGPVMERTLNDLGVTTFQQLAEFSQEDVDKVSAAIGAFPGRIERDGWVEKARAILRKQGHPA